MSKTDELRQMIATLLRLSPAEIGPETPLTALSTSLGGARVRVGLKRLGLTLPSNSNPTTFGALLAAISGEESGVEASATVRVPATVRAPGVPDPQAAVGVGGLPGLCIGLDIEDIRSLPEAKDYWEDEFYRANFAKTEISYAVLQTDPRTHFTGFWCAKEALRKCDPAFATVSPASTAVAHDPNGRPYLTLDTEAGLVRLPHAVSISHTTELATAIVVTIQAASSPTPAHPEVAVDSDPISAEPAHGIEVRSSTELVAVSQKMGVLARLFGRRTDSLSFPASPRDGKARPVP